MTLFKKIVSHYDFFETGKSLDTALHRINRSDIAEQCIFNEQIKSKTSAHKEDLGITRTEAFDERDIMKVSESVEDLMQSDRGRIKADERDEKKYLAEEKEIEEEEEKKTVKERKQEIERRLSQVSFNFAKNSKKTGLSIKLLADEATTFRLNLSFFCRKDNIQISNVVHYPYQTKK